MGPLARRTPITTALCLVATLVLSPPGATATTGANAGPTVRTVEDDSTLTEGDPVTADQRAGVVTGVADATAEVGETVTFRSEGWNFPSGSLSARWEVSTNDGQTWQFLKSDSSMFNFLATDYTTPRITAAMDGNLYRAVYSGNVITRAGRLTVSTPAPPVITHHPSDQTTLDGGTATFTGGASGDSTGCRQWEVSTDGTTWTAIPGATAVSYVVEDATLAMDGLRYRIVFSNTGGSTASNPARLTVQERAWWESHPDDQQVTEGDQLDMTALLSTRVAGDLVTETSDDDGQTWLTVSRHAHPAGLTAHEARWGPVASAEHDGLTARFVFESDGDRVAVGEPVRVSVSPLVPTVLEHPDDVRTREGGTASFDAAYGGTTFEPTVQWQVSTDGGTTFTDLSADIAAPAVVPLVIAPATLVMDGWLFRVGFSTAAGTAWSEPASLTVHPVRPLHLTVTPRAILVDSLPDLRDVA